MSYQPQIPNRISTTSFNSRDAATLGALGVFQGVGEEVVKYGRVGVSISSDNQTSGTLFMEVSRDNINWGGPARKFIDTRFAQPHMWNIVEKYFRIKYVNNNVEAENLIIQVQYSVNADILLGHQLDEVLIDETEAIITRSVLVGVSDDGSYTNSRVDANGRLRVNADSVESLLRDLIIEQKETNAYLRFMTGGNLSV